MIAGYSGRAVGFITVKPNVYNPFQQFRSQYYFLSGRRLQQYYDVKRDNDVDYAALNKRLLPLSTEDKKEIRKTHDKLKRIDALIDDYDKIDLENQSQRASELRFKILTLIEELQ